MRKGDFYTILCSHSLSTRFTCSNMFTVCVRLVYEQKSKNFRNAKKDFLLFCDHSTHSRNLEILFEGQGKVFICLN